MKYKLFLISIFLLLFAVSAWSEEKGDILKKAQDLDGARKYSKSVVIWQHLYEDFDNSTELNEYLLLMLAQTYYRLDDYNKTQLYAEEGLKLHPSGKYYGDLQYYFGRAKQDLKQKAAYDQIKQTVYDASTQLLIIGFSMATWFAGMVWFVLFKKETTHHLNRYLK